MPTDAEPKLHETFIEDIRRGDLRQSVRRDFRELKEFMLTEERKKQLRAMGRLKRLLYFSWWLLKSLLLKLTPARRILLAVALLLLFMQDSFNISGHNVRISFDFSGLSLLLLLFILMLELKDKLLAKEELEAGRAVQNALMPPRSPDVPGWRLWLFTRSANEVGGDLVDFIGISDSRFGVAVGDVAGKGLRAALMSARLQASLRALAPDFSSLSNLGAKVNQIFCRDCLPSIFASLVYLELQADSGSVRLLNAGHLPPLLVRDGRIKKLEKGGPAVGLLPTAT
ncbi:MAG: PP2C family protein-serine/threonine phosphatase, partial [Bacteroidota bacterium]